MPQPYGAKYQHCREHSLTKPGTKKKREMCRTARWLLVLATGYVSISAHMTAATTKKIDRAVGVWITDLDSALSLSQHAFNDKNDDPAQQAEDKKIAATIKSEGASTTDDETDHSTEALSSTDKFVDLSLTFQGRGKLSSCEGPIGFVSSPSVYFVSHSIMVALVQAMHMSSFHCLVS